jgi:CHASE3 domain sensor protein
VFESFVIGHLVCGNVGGLKYWRAEEVKPSHDETI